MEAFSFFRSKAFIYACLAPTWHGACQGRRPTLGQIDLLALVKGFCLAPAKARPSIKSAPNTYMLHAPDSLHTEALRLRSAERLKAAANALEGLARSSGDLQTANLLHAGAMALAEKAAIFGRDGAAAADFGLRSSLAAAEAFPNL